MIPTRLEDITCISLERISEGIKHHPKRPPNDGFRICFSQGAGAPAMMLKRVVDPVAKGGDEPNVVLQRGLQPIAGSYKLWLKGL